MYAIAEMPSGRRIAPRRPGWWVPLLFALASLSAALAPNALTFRLPPMRSLPLALKAARPLSPRLAVLAQGQAIAGDRAATMRALSLPDSGPGSLLTDAAGDPLVYIQLSQIDARVRAALGAAGAQI